MKPRQSNECSDFEYVFDYIVRMPHRYERMNTARGASAILLWIDTYGVYKYAVIAFASQELNIL